MITSCRTLRLALALMLTLLMAGSFGVRSAAARPIDEGGADVKVMIAPAPTASGDILTYTIKAVNRGDSWAHYAKVVVPFDAAALKLVDVQFSNTPAWVTQLAPGSFEFRTERLNSDDGMTVATVRFAALKAGAGLSERLTYNWYDGAGGGHGRSNLPLATAQPYATLTHRMTANDHFFSGNVFVPGEPVVFWYHLPDGKVVPTEVKNGVIIDAATTDAKDQGANYALADAEGAIDLEFSTGHLAAGEYMMVGRGDISGITAVGHCELLR